ncbi:hypothetical protein BpHYR1_022233 [Brachionus plicatilis]|uniref:Uncharacterized protein n=1 Tax=Brachionus plicatilis TaxID=10195 RepID=A0A3M7T5I8_BRAPC|nr:hypothetical protein BpHYR1_022233 [Brachionus plicatilis]
MNMPYEKCNATFDDFFSLALVQKTYGNLSRNSFQSLDVDLLTKIMYNVDGKIIQQQDIAKRDSLQSIK